MKPFNVIVGLYMMLVGSVILTLTLVEAMDGKYNTPFVYYMIGGFFFSMVYSATHLILSKESFL